MPELPEVEVTRRALAATCEGQRLQKLELYRTNLRYPIDLELAGWRGVDSLEFSRRGKFIFMSAPEVEAAVIHLGMSGRFVIRAEAGADSDRQKHTHYALRLENGASIEYVDPRRFGFLRSSKACSEAVARLGLDAWNGDLQECTERLVQRAARTRRSMHTLLLDQSVLAGIGNIYACEALYKTGIAPQRAANTVGGESLITLVAAVRECLSRAIEQGGTTLKDKSYLAPDQQLGYFAMSLQAYGREGEPCNSCREQIQRTTIGARSVFWCPACQD